MYKKRHTKINSIIISSSSSSSSSNVGDSSSIS